MSTQDFITPDWPAPPCVRARTTTRSGGVSVGRYASLNLGDHVADETSAVTANRRELAARLALPDEPLWMSQVHGTTVWSAPDSVPKDGADAAVTRTPDQVLAVLTADCLPVLLCTLDGRCVGAAHAGWRGLAGGVLEATLTAMQAPPATILAWLGPAIGPDAFEVGDEVRAAFIARHAQDISAFRRNDNGRWQADLYSLARARLTRAGVPAVYGGDYCTVSEPRRFFSYRRDGDTGRMASLIWISG